MRDPDDAEYRKAITLSNKVAELTAKYESKNCRSITSTVSMKLICDDWGGPTASNTNFNEAKKRSNEWPDKMERNSHEAMKSIVPDPLGKRDATESIDNINVNLHGMEDCERAKGMEKNEWGNHPYESGCGIPKELHTRYSFNKRLALIETESTRFKKSSKVIIDHSNRLAEQTDFYGELIVCKSNSAKLKM